MWQSVLDHLKLPFLLYYNFLSLSLITVSKKNNNAKQATIFLLIRIFFKKEKNKKALNYSELINTST